MLNAYFGALCILSDFRFYWLSHLTAFKSRARVLGQLQCGTGFLERTML